MSNRNSLAIANAIATPKVLNSPNLSNAKTMEVAALITPLAAEASASIHRYMRVPSNARVSSLKISAADATVAGTYDIGLHDIDGGAVVDVDFFSVTFDLALGPVFNADAIQVAAVAGVLANSEKMVWELLGLATDPKKLYDVTGVVNLTFDGGPTAILMKLTFIQ